MKKLFEFKTSVFYWDRERMDVKNNTVREIDLSDERFTNLIAWMETGWDDGEIQIRIVNAFNDKHFTRNIRDICIWENIMIITWNEVITKPSDYENPNIVEGEKLMKEKIINFALRRPVFHLICGSIAFIILWLIINLKP